MNQIIEDIVKNQQPCYFISPHLDDAIFSAGSLMSYLIKHTEVTLVTVFTECGEQPFTLSAKQFLKQCGFSSAESLFEARKQEDISACKSIGCNFKHLGYVDALFRKKNQENIIPFLGELLPEFIHIYPTYRLHINKHVVSVLDNDLKQDLSKRLLKIVSVKKNPVIFAPSGFGGHVDHVLVRDVCKDTFPKTIYWTDYPYVNHMTPNQIDKSKVGEPVAVWANSFGEKLKTTSIYQSQVKAIFGNTPPIFYPEIYYER